MEEIRGRAESDQRVLVTTLTKKMAEDLTDYLVEMGIRVRYLHSEVDTLQRIEIVRDLRLGEFDVLVGINLLREGLDLPEVSLVAILDADKEGFLRSDTSLVQTIGRAARNVDGTVLMYADSVTDSMRAAIGETQRRRKIQLAYNEEHGIDPQTIRKQVTDILLLAARGEEAASSDRASRRVFETPVPTASPHRGARAADPGPRGGDAPSGPRPAVRVRGQAARRGPRAPEGAPPAARSRRGVSPHPGQWPGHVRRASLHWGAVGTDSLVIHGAREHNLKNVDARAAPRRADRVHGPVRIGQVVAGVRHDLRGGPAPLRGVAVVLRPAVPGPDGEARRRLHRGAVAGDLDRPEVDVAQPAVDGRHDHRDLRLPARPVRAGRTPALLQLRPPDRPPDPASRSSTR